MSHQQSCNKAASEALQVSAQAIGSGSAALQANGETLQAGNHALQSNSNALEAGNETLKADQVLSSHFELASEAQKSFADLKYWLTDLAVSWLNESEENADAAGERLAGQLEKIAAFAPKTVDTISALVEAVNETAMEAVDAYVEENRVLGNSLLAKARDGMLAVDTELAALANDLHQPPPEPPRIRRWRMPRRP